MFVSGEALNGRTDCGTQGVPDTVSHDRLRGIRDLRHHRHRAPEIPHQRADMPRLAHAHRRDRPARLGQRLHLYLRLGAASALPRSWPDARRRMPEEDPNSALFRIEVIKVPLAAPEQAKIVSSPRIFNDLAPPARHGEIAADSLAAPKRRGRRLPARPSASRRTSATANRSHSVPRHHRLSGHRPRRRRVRRVRPAARHP